MPLLVICDCGKSLQVKDSLAGKRIDCPECQEPLTVPAIADEASAEDPSPENSLAETPGKTPLNAVRPPELEESEQPRIKAGAVKKVKQAQKSFSTLLLVLGVGTAMVVMAGCVTAALLIMNAPAEPKKSRPQADNKGNARGDKGGRAKVEVLTGQVELTDKELAKEYAADGYWFQP